MIKIWPADLPQVPLLNGYEEEVKPNAVVFKPEYGDDVTRRRSTVRITNMRVSFMMTKKQVAEFVDFFQDEIVDGTLPFRMKDWISGGDVTMRFDLSGAPYRIQARTPNVALVSLSLKRVQR